MNLSLSLTGNMGLSHGEAEVLVFPATLFAAGEAGAWYDPSDLSTLWQDTAGTTPVTADGQSVARIDDKSGNGLNLLQATAGLRPLYKTAGGLHWLEFDGTDDRLTVGSGIAGASQTVGLAGANPTGTAGCPYASSTASADRLGFRLDGSALSVGHYNGSAWLAKSGAGSTTSNVLLGEIVKSVSTALRVNAAAQSGTTVPFGAGVAVTALGANNSANFFPGRIYGLLQIARALSAAERDELEAYLAEKAGITL